MGKTFKNFRNDLREDSTRGRPKTATRLEKAIEKYKKSIYNMQEDLDDDDFDDDYNYESNDKRVIHRK